jgi:hypothetical protein
LLSVARKTSRSRWPIAVRSGIFVFLNAGRAPSTGPGSPSSFLRPHAGAFSLDREGFELSRFPTAVADLYHDKAVEEVYYPEIATAP